MFALHADALSKLPMQRKEFLRALTLGTAGAGLLPAGLQATAPAPPTLADPPAAPQVKITSIKAYALDEATFVKIETDAGVSGWGEADHDNPSLTRRIIERVCAPMLIGRDPWQTEYFWQQLIFKAEDIGGSGLLPGSISGIDNALWDIKGKLTGLPVYKLLGGANVDKIRLYGSFGRGKDEGGALRTADEMAAMAAGFVQQGYLAVKARMQIRQLNIDPDPDSTYEIIRAVRKAIGDDIQLFVDFNNGYTPARAIMMARKLFEQFNIAIVEEPVTYNNYRDLAQVVEALDIPVAAGEHEYNRWQMRELIVEGKVDIVNTDIIKAGGITENRRIAALAQAFDRPIMAHNTRPTLMSAASLHFLASIPNAGRFQEFAGFRPSMGLDGLFENALEFKDGHIMIPQIPGIGLIANEKAIIKAAD